MLDHTTACAEVWSVSTTPPSSTKCTIDLTTSPKFKVARYHEAAARIVQEGLDHADTSKLDAARRQHDFYKRPNGVPAARLGSWEVSSTAG